MKVRLITVGKMKSKPHLAIALDYIKRLGHYLSFEMFDVKKEEDVLKKIGVDDYLVVCDERGSEMSSKEFAKFIEERQIRSTKGLTFVIGPSEGLGEHLKSKAKKKLGLSKMTLQHDMAALILLEQIYRACTILKGEPYHK